MIALGRIVFNGLTIGVTCFIGVLPLASARAGTLSTLVQFTGGATGSNPVSGVVQDAAGTLYGETSAAGSTECVTNVGTPSLGCGTLYSFNPTSGLKALVAFNGPNGAYGYYTPILLGSTLYASTLYGGSTDNGVLFSIHTNGTGFRLLHQFVGTDGSEPTGSLVLGPGPALFGVTSAGGAAYPGKTYGVLFKLSENGTYTVLHTFTNGTDGGYPNSIIVEKSGAIIGSTFQGGHKGGNCLTLGCGVIYQYNPKGSAFSTLYTFTGPDGSEPVLGSVGSNGTVYGNSGNFFQYSLTSGFSPLPGTLDGTNGFGLNVGPVLSPTGSLTSVEQQGPSDGAGTLYQQLNGTITLLYGFSGPDGSDPQATPLLTSAGSFIGTTGAGGAACNCGTIYKYTP